MCGVTLSVLLSYRQQFSASSPTKSSDCSSNTSCSRSKKQTAKAQSHGKLVRLLLLQQPLNRIMLAFCDISSACEAVVDGMHLYKSVTILLKLQAAFNPSVNQSMNICNVLGQARPWGATGIQQTTSSLQ